MIRFFILLLLLTTLILNADEPLKKYKFAYINSSMSNYSQVDLKITMDIWMKEVAKNIGNVEMIFYNDPKKAAKDINNGKVDFISAFPIIFIKYFDMSKLENGFTGKYKDPDDNKFVILIKKGIEKKDLKDIKNLKIGIQKNDTIMQIYAKNYYKTPNIVKYKNRSRIVLDIYFSKIDIGIVPYRTYKLSKELNPNISKKVKFLKKTNFVSNAFGFYRKGILKVDKEFIFNTGIELFSSVKGKQMMDIYKIETLVKTKISDLKNANTLNKSYLKK